MSIGLDAISAIIATIALVIAILTWLFPKKPSNKIPEFRGHVTEASSHKLAEFILSNENEIVKLRAVFPMDEPGLITENVLTLKRNNVEGDCIGGVEIAVHPEKGSDNSPLIFANAGYHLNGFFAVRIYPGIHQGYVSASLTEVSAEQMALRR
jgi:hypothetical protein